MAAEDEVPLLAFPPEGHQPPAFRDEDSSLSLNDALRDENALYLDSATEGERDGVVDEREASAILI